MNKFNSMTKSYVLLTASLYKLVNKANLVHSFS